MIVYLPSRKISKARAMRLLTDRIVRRNPKAVVATVTSRGEIRIEKPVGVPTQLEASRPKS